MARHNILIIDDDQDTSHLFAMVLGAVGFECECAYSAKAGFSRLIQSKPDILLLDLHLGHEIGGRDILYQIRSNPRLTDIVVVVITGYPSMAQEINGLANLTLIKPIDVNQLRLLVQRLARKEIEPRSVYFRDPITGVYNQDFLSTRLEHAYQRAKRREDFLFGVLVLTVEFEPTPDEGDPAILEELQRAVASQIMASIRPTDTIARLAGNKFAILLEEIKHSEDTQVVSRRLAGQIMAPQIVKDVQYRTVVQIGSAVHGREFINSTQIVTMAETEFQSFP